ncbi:MAG: T9SS type A sorting domain-containing protein [Prolixibacteraceae bacterium]
MAGNSGFGNSFKGITYLTLVSSLIIFNASFTKKNTNPHLAPEPWIRFSQITNYNSLNQRLPGDKLKTFSFKTNELKLSHYSFEVNTVLPFFPIVYIGNGVDHMSINLVNLNSTGLQLGDEIGIFDSIFCVGSAVISEKNLLNDNISIPASANDTIPSSPNGYIEGHKITLRIYRAGIIYNLYFELVNNSQDIFEKWGSMYALVNFSKSTGKTETALINSVNIYPNPFSETIHIEVSFSRIQFLNCEILDLSGNLVRSLFQGKGSLKMNLSWDATDFEDKKVPSGIYFCRINQTNTKIIYQSVAGKYKN